MAEKSFQSENVTFKLFGALKLVRVLRLSRIIGHNKSSEEFKAFLKLNKLVFFLLIYLHVFGCLWWMLVSDDENWVPPIEYRDHELYFLYEQPIAYKYTVCLHAAVLLTTGRNPGPIGVYQMAVSTIGLFVGAIINANIFGELAVLAA